MYKTDNIYYINYNIPVILYNKSIYPYIYQMYKREYNNFNHTIDVLYNFVYLLYPSSRGYYDYTPISRDEAKQLLEEAIKVKRLPKQHTHYLARYQNHTQHKSYRWFNHRVRGIVKMYSKLLTDVDNYRGRYRDAGKYKEYQSLMWDDSYRANTSGWKSHKRRHQWEH